MTVQIKITIYHKWWSLDLEADSTLVCHVASLFVYVSQIAWLTVISYRRLLGTIWRVAFLCIHRLLAYVSQIAYLCCNFNYGVTIVLWFCIVVAWNLILSCLPICIADCLPVYHRLHDTLLSWCVKSDITLAHPTIIFYEKDIEFQKGSLS